jgi:hypothetical protein
MARITVVFGILLILLGSAFYAGIAVTQGKAPSVTALIPSFAGIPILLLGLVAFREAYRKHAMHVVSVLALLGFLLPALRLVMQLAGGAEAKPTALASMAGMAVLCGALFALCLKSFVDARRARGEQAR